MQTVNTRKWKKNPIETEKNSDRFLKKTYSFDVTKCDEIFDFLVKDGQMIVLPGEKMPPLDQRKKRSFCKYQAFLGHKTSQCFIFRDLVQGAIKDGRLKFADKPPMKIDAKPLQEDAHYAEPSCINMVEVLEDFINKPIFGSFTEDISRNVIKEVQRKAPESLNKGSTEG